jgi:hypothetical protein
MYPAIVLFCEMAVECFQIDDRLLDIRDRQDMYWVRRFGMMEELNAKNTEGDDDENLEELPPLYIRLRQH